MVLEIAVVQEATVAGVPGAERQAIRTAAMVPAAAVAAAVMVPMGPQEMAAMEVQTRNSILRTARVVVAAAAAEVIHRPLEPVGPLRPTAVAAVGLDRVPRERTVAPAPKASS
jgi:hypothetical protein